MQFVKFAPAGYNGSKELYIRKDKVVAIRADKDNYDYYTFIWLEDGVWFKVRATLREVLDELGIKP